MNKHDGWLKAAGDACSFMRMYALALEISADAPDLQLRQAANDVVSALEGVIHAPIADSRNLKEARRRFTIMLTCLSGEEGLPVQPRPGSFVFRMSMGSR